MNDLLEAVKTRLSIEGPALDKTIQALIDDVCAYAIAAGVPAEVLKTEQAYGLIAMGVNDIWSNDGKNGFSTLFEERIIQMQNLQQPTATN